MSIRNLGFLFRPKSIAVIGASDRAGSVGATVMRNVLAGGFTGPIYAVNPAHILIAGQRAYADVAQLPQTPDLALLATPPATIPALIDALGRRGTRAAVVLTGGLAKARDAQGNTIMQAMRTAARPHLLRILGPNCVGLLVPGLGLNASFAHTSALPGKLAFVSQSGGLTTAVLDWAKSRGIGFSHFISLGEAADVDFGDVLDYLASDSATRAILLYIESITAARKFMSAARAAARNKPVLVVKAGRALEGARAAASHIRRGLQYECIGCAACIDSCNQVMDKMGYARGLIRYATENALTRGLTPRQMIQRVLRPRVLVYMALLAVISGTLLVALVLRNPLKVDVIRDRAALMRETRDGRIENIYRLQIMNTDERAHRYVITASGLSGIRVTPFAPVAVAGATTQSIAVTLEVDPAGIKPGSHNIMFHVEDLEQPSLRADEKSRFYIQ